MCFPEQKLSVIGWSTFVTSSQTNWKTDEEEGGPLDRRRRSFSSGPVFVSHQHHNQGSSGAVGSCCPSVCCVFKAFTDQHDSRLQFISKPEHLYGNTPDRQQQTATRCVLTEEIFWDKPRQIWMESSRRSEIHKDSNVSQETSRWQSVDVPSVVRVVLSSHFALVSRSLSSVYDRDTLVGVSFSPQIWQIWCWKKSK